MDSKGLFKLFQASIMTKKRRNLSLIIVLSNLGNKLKKSFSGPFVDYFLKMAI